MPVKITLYAENIAVGTEIVEAALKLGGALSVYDPDVKSPINAKQPRPKQPRPDPKKAAAVKAKVLKKAKANRAHLTPAGRMKATTLLDLDPEGTAKVTQGSVRARVWAVVEDLPLPLNRRQIAVQVADNDRTLDASQAMTAVKWMITEGILQPVQP